MFTGFDSIYFKWILSLLKYSALAIFLFVSITIIVYWLIEPRQDREWAPEHSRLASIEFQGSELNPKITVHNLRDFSWSDSEKEALRYKDMHFSLEDIVELKAGVSHFSPINEIAHVFMTFVLIDGRELGVSIEARRELGESFSLHGGLLAHFELIYVLATPEDLITVRKQSNDTIHMYPIKETKEKARELFLLIAKRVNSLNKKPELYHLLFKNCTNQLVKDISILTKQFYPLYFQTLAPGLTGRTLYELDLIDMPKEMSFREIQEKTKQ